MRSACFVAVSLCVPILAACPFEPARPAAETSTDPTVSPETSNGDVTAIPTTTGTSESSSDTSPTEPVTTVNPTVDASSEGSSSGTTGTCGDDIVDPGEECDLGSSQLMCDADCTLPVCGDGFENFPAGEYCDPGAAGETELCNADCSLAECGDLIVNATAGEECDEGEATPTCNADCTAAGCGDGVVNEEGDEDCDDEGESMSCDADCTFASCGDGTINATAGETCDDGDETVTCDDDCTAVMCGDMVVNAAAGELCDDGNNDPDDGCDNCFADCGNDCWSDLGCMTAEGRCIRFTCTDGQSSETACDDCFGWTPVTYDNWLNQGYCPDITASYRAAQGNAPMCGGAPICCADPAGCGGGDNAWHFHNGANNYYVGPCLGCADDMNCTYWNNVDDSNYTRITACIRG